MNDDQTTLQQFAWQVRQGLYPDGTISTHWAGPSKRTWLNTDCLRDDLVRALNEFISSSSRACESEGRFPTSWHSPAGMIIRDKYLEALDLVAVAYDGLVRPLSQAERMQCIEDRLHRVSPLLLEAVRESAWVLATAKFTGSEDQSLTLGRFIPVHRDLLGALDLLRLDREAVYEPRHTAALPMPSHLDQATKHHPQGPDAGDTGPLPENVKYIAAVLYELPSHEALQAKEISSSVRSKFKVWIDTENVRQIIKRYRNRVPIAHKPGIGYYMPLVDRPTWIGDMLVEMSRGRHA